MLAGRASFYILCNSVILVCPENEKDFFDCFFAFCFFCCFFSCCFVCLCGVVVSCLLFFVGVSCGVFFCVGFWGFVGCWLLLFWDLEFAHWDFKKVSKKSLKL